MVERAREYTHQYVTPRNENPAGYKQKDLPPWLQDPIQQAQEIADDEANQALITIPSETPQEPDLQLSEPNTEDIPPDVYSEFYYKHASIFAKNKLALEIANDNYSRLVDGLNIPLQPLPEDFVPPVIDPDELDKRLEESLNALEPKDKERLKVIQDKLNKLLCTDYAVKAIETIQLQFKDKSQVPDFGEIELSCPLQRAAIDQINDLLKEMQEIENLLKR